MRRGRLAELMEIADTIKSFFENLASSVGSIIILLASALGILAMFKMIVMALFVGWRGK